MLLKEDVIEPTLDSINRLIDVLTGVGGQLRESSLGVISRLVNSKKSLNIRELDVQRSMLKDKLESAQAHKKSLDPDGNADPDDPAMKEINAKISNLITGIEAYSKKIKIIRQSLFSLSNQNLLFKLAFARMNEIATQFGGTGFPVEPVTGPDDLNLGTGDLEDEDTLEPDKAPDVKLEEIFTRLKDEFNKSVTNLDNQYFRKQKQAGVGGRFIEQIYVDGAAVLDNIKQRIVASNSPDMIKQAIKTGNGINLKISIEITVADLQQHEEQLKNVFDIKLKQADVKKHLLTEKLNGEFYARVKDLMRSYVATSVTGKDVKSVIDILSKIPVSILQEVAGGGKRFEDFKLGGNMLSMLKKSISSYKARYPQAVDPEKEFAGYLFNYKVGLDGAMDDAANVPDNIDTHDTLVDVQAAVTDQKEKEDLAKLQTIIDKTTEPEQLDQIQTIVVKPTNSDEFNQGATTLIDLKRNTMGGATMPSAAPPEATQTPSGSINDIVANIVSTGAVTEQDVVAAAQLLNIQDYDLITKPLTKAIGKGLGNNPEVFIKLSNDVADIVSSLRFKQSTGTQDVAGDQLTSADEIRVGMNLGTTKEALNNLKQLQAGYAQFSKLIEWESGMFVRERWKDIIKSRQWEKVDLSKLEVMLADFEAKNDKSLEVLKNNKDVNGLLNVYKIWSGQ